MSTYHESLLAALERGENIPLCQDDYEDLHRYLNERDEKYTGILSDRATVEESFGELVHYESQGGWGE